MTEPIVNTGIPVVNPNTTVPPTIPGVSPQVAPKPVTPPPAGVKPGVSSPDVKVEVKSDSQTVPLAALQEEREKRQQLQVELEKLRTPQPQQQQYQQQQPVGDIRQEVDKLWESDPKRAVQTEIMLGLTWLDNVNSSIEEQLDSIAIKDPTFQTYRPQVRAYLKSLPLEQRGRPGVAELALAVSKGQNVDAIIQQTKDELYRKFQAGELAGMINPPAAGTFTQQPASQGTQLTPEQIAVARAMGMSEQEYAKNIKGR
jgi:hypothetical protein